MQAARLQGHDDVSNFNPENDEPESHGRWLRLSAEVLRDAGYTAVLDEDRMNVYITGALAPTIFPLHSLELSLRQHGSHHGDEYDGHNDYGIDEVFV